MGAGFNPHPALTRAFNGLVERNPDGFDVGSVPSLPGCHQQARSLDEFMERIQEAIQFDLDVEGTTVDNLDFVGFSELR